MDFGALFTDMQDKMKKVKEDLELSRIDGESGSGKIRVVVSGSKKLEEVHIDPSMLSPDQKEELEDLLLVAIGRALDKADVKAAEAMQGVSGGMLPGMGLPGLF